MRTMTGGETTLLAGPEYKVTPRVKVANGSGTMIDLTTWMQSIRIERDIDMPVSSATVEFRRDSGTTLSLAPLRADSLLNRDDLGNYSPQMDPGRAITIEIATHALNTSPVAGDYKLLFVGNLDRVDWEKSPLVTQSRDQGGQLVDRWIETAKPYGSTTGMPLETVMQKILDDVFGTVNPVSLFVPVSPGFQVTRYNQQKQSVMDALFALAQLIGWDVRYKFDSGTGTFRLTLSQPPRTKTVPDYTFGPSQYLDITTLNINRENIRNVISVEFRNAATNARINVVASDSTSIARYGRRYFEMSEGDDSPIDTGSEATTLASAVLPDLKDPKAEHELETHFFWPAELNDLYRQSPNAIHYNSDQDFAVVNITDELTTKRYRSTIKTRGKPAGAYDKWLARQVPLGRPPYPQPDTGLALNNFRVVAEDGTSITYGWDAGGLVAEVWAADILFTEPLPADPWTQVLFAIAPLPLGTVTYTVQKPVEGQIRLVQVEPRDANLTPGTVRRVVLNQAPTQPPTIELDDIETDTTGTQWWKVTERGLAVTNVEVQTQIGIQPISPWGVPTRDAGDTSLVRGGTLGTGEYEHDVALHPDRTSWIMPRLTLSNGAQVVLGPFGFDRDKIPNFLSISLTGTVLTIIADTDTKSLRVYDKLGTWEYILDGANATIDVSKTGTNAVAGLGASASSTFTIEARSDPIANVDAGTIIVSQDLVIAGASAAAPSATWDTPGLVLTAPPAGSYTMQITLRATGAPAGWTVKLYFGTTTPSTDITGDVSPALSAPPIVSTSYDYVTEYQAVSGSSWRLRTVKVKADLLDNLGVVQDTRTATASWHASILV